MRTASSRGPNGPRTPRARRASHAASAGRSVSWEVKKMATPLELIPRAPALRLARLPGESGPVLRCSGELTVTTAEALRRELALLAGLGHPSLTLDVAALTRLDLYGVVTILEASE